MAFLAVSNVATAQPIGRDQFNEAERFLKHHKVKQESKNRYQQQLQAAQARREQQQVQKRQQKRAAYVPQNHRQQAPSKRQQYQAPRNHLTTALNKNPKCRINIQAVADTVKRSMDAVYHGQTSNDRSRYVRVVSTSLEEVRRAEAQCARVAFNGTHYPVSRGDIRSLERSIRNNRNRNTGKLSRDTVMFGNHLRKGGHALTATLLYEVVVGYLSTER
jgi:hypothetical protein